MNIQKYLCVTLWLLLVPSLFAKEPLSPEELQIFHNAYNTTDTSAQAAPMIIHNQEAYENSTQTIEPPSLKKEEEPFSIKHSVYLDGSLLLIGHVSVLYRYRFSKYFSVIGGPSIIGSGQGFALGAAAGINFTTHRDKPGPEFYTELILDNMFLSFMDEERGSWGYFPLPRLVLGSEFISREGVMLRLGIGAYPVVWGDGESTRFMPVPFFSTAIGYSW